MSRPKSIVRILLGHFGRLLLGVGLLALVPVKFCNGTVPLSLLLLLICCTKGGLPALVILPGFWLVGSLPFWLVWGIVRLVRPSGTRSEPRVIPMTPPAPMDYRDSLQEYVRSARDSGLADQRIRDLCIEQGATRDEIEMAIGMGLKSGGGA